MMFFLPIGHEQGTVRRLPWVTFGIMAACVLMLLATSYVIPDMQARAVEIAAELQRLFHEHPQLQLTEKAQDFLFQGLDADRRQAVLEMYRSAPPSTETEQDQAAAQAQFDALLEKMMALAESLPYRRWGLVPAAPSPVTLLSHMFLHGGWLHLLGNLLILYLAGPFIEDVWGRAIYGGFYLAGGVVAALVFMVRHPDLTVPLVGASGAIAAVMGAFLVRYWSTEIHFFYIAFFFHGNFSAPAWTMLPMWFGEQLFMAMVGGPAAGGVAYVAHVGGFAFGVATALLMRRQKVEERLVRPAIEARTNRTVLEERALDEALAAQSRGEAGTAFTLLMAEAGREPRDTQVSLALWQVAQAQNRQAEAAPAVMRCIEEQMRHHQVEPALERWIELMAAVPAVCAGSALLVRLAHALSGSGRRQEAMATLRLALLDPEDRMSAATALHIAREACELDPALARSAVHLAMTRPGITEAERTSAQALLTAPPLAAEPHGSQPAAH